MIWVNARTHKTGKLFCLEEQVSNKQIERSIAMTHHLLQADTVEDQRTMRRLATVIGGCIVATALLALAVGLTMG